MEKKFYEIINKNNLISKGDRILVACSGGADSVALLLLLNKIKIDLSLELVAVHVNHNIRGEEANEDERFAKKLANNLGVEFVSKSVDAIKYSKDKKFTLEQGARELRYQIFNQVKEEFNLNKIAVAHNKDDQSETILMHIFRGSGLTGAIGMGYFAGDIVRPLLDFTKQEILEYLSSCGVPHKEDKTNKETKYTRNFIRHKIIKEVQSVYPKVLDNIDRFSKKLRKVDEFLDSITPKHLLEIKGNLAVLSQKANLEDEIIIERLIIKALESLNSRVDVEEKHISDIMNLFNAQIGKGIDLPNGLRVQKGYHGLEFIKDEGKPFGYESFNIDGNLGDINIQRVKSLNLEQGVLFVDEDQIPSGAVWRKLEKGDKFTKFSGGTKSAIKFLIDKKMGLNERNNLLVLAVDKEVLLIPGVEISKKVRVTDKTKSILKIEVRGK